MLSGSAYNLNSQITQQQALSRQIAQLQTDISTEIKIHVASDDPAAAARVSQIQITQSNNAVYTSNINTARSIAALVDTNMSGLTTSMTQAKELMLQAANQTLNANDRAAIVTQLQGIAADVATASSATDSTGQPLYATGGAALSIPIGRATNVAPGESYSAVFEGVPRSDGSTGSIADILQAAIAAASSGDPSAIQASITDVGNAGTQINDAQSDAGVRSARINSMSDRLANDAVDLSDERSGLEDTDLTAAAATLSQKMTTLSAAQSILAQLSKTSLFDKLG